MELSFQRDVAHRYASLVRDRNSLLLYGKPADTIAVLRGMYELAQKDTQFRCSWHDASQIQHPLDFFEPILN